MLITGAEEGYRFLSRFVIKLFSTAWQCLECNFITMCCVIIPMKKRIMSLIFDYSPYIIGGIGQESRYNLSKSHPILSSGNIITSIITISMSFTDSYNYFTNNIPFTGIYEFAFYGGCS